MGRPRKVQPQEDVVELGAVAEDLLVTVVGDKKLYGKKVISCAFDGRYYTLVDSELQTFKKSPEELDEILK